MDASNINKLANKLQKGDHKAGADLFDHFAPLIYRFFMSRINHRESAQDLLQDVFLKLVKNIRQFDSEQGNFSSWFWSIAHNTLIDFFREKKAGYIADLEEKGEYIIDARDSTRSNAELREIMEIVKTLSPEERELFELYFVMDLPYAEIAATTGKSESNLRVTIHRIRKKITEKHG